MSDVIRLSDLLPAYCKQHGVGIQTAAYALRELIQELQAAYKVDRPNLPIPSDLIWVGQAGSSDRAIKEFNIYFDGLSEYFGSFIDTGVGVELVTTLCVADVEVKGVPAQMLYISWCNFCEWVLAADLEPPILKVGEGREATSRRMLDADKVGEIVDGLIKLIVEVDRAHAAPGDEDRRRMEKVRLRAQDLRVPPRKNANLAQAVISLADAAGVDMPKRATTLEKYMG